jgi:hypothetical protein
MGQDRVPGRRLYRGQVFAKEQQPGRLQGLWPGSREGVRGECVVRMDSDAPGAPAAAAAAEVYVLLVVVIIYPPDDPDPFGMSGLFDTLVEVE